MKKPSSDFWLVLGLSIFWILFFAFVPIDVWLEPAPAIRVFDNPRTLWHEGDTKPVWAWNFTQKTHLFGSFPNRAKFSKWDFFILLLKDPIGLLYALMFLVGGMWCFIEWVNHPLRKKQSEMMPTFVYPCGLAFGASHDKDCQKCRDREKLKPGDFLRKTQ